MKIQLSRQTGCEPDLARDGKEALDVVSAYASSGHVYFIVFMDIVMPKMDGHQATLAIRQLERDRKYRKTFICGMISANPSAEFPQSRLTEAGMDFFSKGYAVSKPLQEAQISQVFARARIA